MTAATAAAKAWEAGHRVTDIHLIPTTEKESAVADDLYRRYMAAFEVSTEHTTGCTACQAGQPCRTGRPLHERFARLQDAYRRRSQRRR